MRLTSPPSIVSQLFNVKIKTRACRVSDEVDLARQGVWHNDAEVWGLESVGHCTQPFYSPLCLGEFFAISIDCVGHGMHTIEFICTQTDMTLHVGLE